MMIDIAHLIDSKSVEKYQNRYSSAAKQFKNCELVGERALAALSLPAGQTANGRGQFVTIS